ILGKILPGTDAPTCRWLRRPLSFPLLALLRAALPQTANLRTAMDAARGLACARNHSSLLRVFDCEESHAEFTMMSKGAAVGPSRTGRRSGRQAQGCRGEPAAGCLPPDRRS